MKRFKSIIMVAVLGCGSLLTGCEDWLDYQPKDKQTYEQQFGTKVGFRNAVNGVYGKIGSSSLYGYDMSFGSLDFMGMLYSIPSANLSRYEFQTANWSGDYASSTILSIWTTAYNTILNANLIINAAEENKGSVLSEEEYKLIKGEMLAVRAFLHLDMARLFGSRYTSDTEEELCIPYNDGIEATRRERLSNKVLFETKLLPDLEAAEELLSEVDPVIADGVLASDGGLDGNWERYRQLRMNYYAVLLLKARAYLWMGDYENALTEARKLTDNETVKNHFPFVNASTLLGNGVNPDRIFSTECLFGFYYNGLDNIYENYFAGTKDHENLLQPRKGYVDILFSSQGDYRRQTHWTGSAAVAGSEYDFVKYRGFTANQDSPEFWASFFGLIRLSEAYYIAAECLLKTDLSEACTYLNIILKARGAQELDASSIFLTRADVLKEIKMEYLREMRGEGQIYFMLKRFNQDLGATEGDTDFNGAVISNDDDPGPSVRYVVPIPKEETI